MSNKTDSELLGTLKTISEQQMTICEQLDRLILLLKQPSEPVLQILQHLLAPMNKDMGHLESDLHQHILNTED